MATKEEKRKKRQIAAKVTLRTNTTKAERDRAEKRIASTKKKVGAKLKPKKSTLSKLLSGDISKEQEKRRKRTAR